MKERSKSKGMLRLSSKQVCIRLTLFVLAIVVFSAPLHISAAPQFIGGPVLGFLPDQNGTVIRPIMGIPGASIPGQPLSLSDDIVGAAISPRQNYAIASRSTDAQVVVIDFAAEPPVVTAVIGASSCAGLLAISPTGSAAAVYDSASGTVEVIGGLPNNAAVVAAFDISSISSATVTRLAISDDGTLVLAKVSDGQDAGLWVLSSNGPWRISLDSPSAATFFPDRHDAVVTDDSTRTAYLLMDIDHAASQIPLASAGDGIESFSNAAVAEDGQRVFLADTGSGVITAVDMQTQTSILISCQCRPTGLYRLSGNSVFRLTEPSDGPMMLLDASSGDPRIGIIPPPISVARPQEHHEVISE
jgi:DNA-binding beta-propeller fold protein YncE